MRSAKRRDLIIVIAVDVAGDDAIIISLCLLGVALAGSNLLLPVFRRRRCCRTCCSPLLPTTAASWQSSTFIVLAYVNTCTGNSSLLALHFTSSERDMLCDGLVVQWAVSFICVCVRTRLVSPSTWRQLFSSCMDVSSGCALC